MDTPEGFICLDCGMGDDRYSIVVRYQKYLVHRSYVLADADIASKHHPKHLLILLVLLLPISTRAAYHH